MTPTKLALVSVFTLTRSAGDSTYFSSFTNSEYVFDSSFRQQQQEKIKKRKFTNWPKSPFLNK